MKTLNLAALVLATLALSLPSCVVTGDLTLHDPITGATVTVGKNPIGSK